MRAIRRIWPERRQLALLWLIASVIALGALMVSLAAANLDATTASYTAFAQATGAVQTGTFPPPVNPAAVPPECPPADYNVITGTEGNDTLYGTNGRDLIFGLGGHDTIYGGNQDDCIDGGPGDDTLKGDNANDVLIGGEGHDKLYAENAGDKLYGGSGEDRLYGGNGADYLDGGADNDKLFGGNGPDYLDGGPGYDHCDGGNGDDTKLNCEADGGPHSPHGHHSVPTIDLTWQPAVEALRYNVYRSLTPGGPYVLLATTPATAYSDAGVAEDLAYYYVITATIIEGLESEPSAEVSALVPSPTATPAATATPVATATPAPVLAPAGLTADVDAALGVVMLTWRAAGDAITYRVYASTAPDATPVFAEETRGLSSLQVVASGETVYYSVTAVASDGRESAPSATVGASMPAPTATPTPTATATPEPTATPSPTATPTGTPTPTE